MSASGDVKVELSATAKQPSVETTSLLENLSLVPSKKSDDVAVSIAPVPSFLQNSIHSTKAYNDPEHVKAMFAAEGWYFHFLRWLAHVAGVATPLGKEDYDKALKKHGTDARIRSEFITDVNLQCQRMLNQEEGRLPFDWYDICKESKLWFCGLILLLYFLVLCIIFGAIGEACFVEEALPGEFLSRAFLLISGMAQYDAHTAACSWSNVAATFFGLYISLPLFGAVLLVRLLAPLGCPPQLSKNMLYNVQNGKPLLSFRLSNSTGRVVANVEASIWVSCMYKDSETGKNIGKGYDLKLEPYCKFTSGNCNTISHVVDETSPLHFINHGIIQVDEDGIPRADNKRIGVVILNTSYDTEWGGRKLYTMKMFYDTGSLIVEGKLNEDGRRMFPVWENMMLVMMFKWRTSKGEMIPSADNERIHMYRFDEYKTPEEITKEAEEKEAKEAKEKEIEEKQRKEEKEVGRRASAFPIT